MPRRDFSAVKDKRSQDNRNCEKSSKWQSAHSSSASEKSHHHRNKGKSIHLSQKTKKTPSENANKTTSAVNEMSSDKEKTHCKFCFGELPSYRCSFLASLNRTARKRLIMEREAKYQHSCENKSWVQLRPSRPRSRDSAPNPRGNSSVSFAYSCSEDTRARRSRKNNSGE